MVAGAGDVALVRTGYMRHWPDEALMAEHRGPGPDESAARLLADRGVVAVGSDTRPSRCSPRPTRASLEPAAGAHAAPDRARDLHHGEPRPEELARSGAREFLFVALPLSIRGATGSMIDPVAVV